MSKPEQDFLIFIRLKIKLLKWPSLQKARLLRTYNLVYGIYVECWQANILAKNIVNESDFLSFSVLLG